MKPVIKKVYENAVTKQKLIFLPKDFCEKGEYVVIKKVNLDG